ncbi:hypothetical protein [Methanoculleus chikugoensis]|uniref:hypothetical protein n=1 Tax=Methanoculleus chikugoensis TaxID=118126 RepID=UPI001FB3671B|nr:hypothetical protein [Methanoculleus chikugoensis]
MRLRLIEELRAYPVALAQATGSSGITSGAVRTGGNASSTPSPNRCCPATSPRTAVPNERPGLFVGDRVGRLGVERDDAEDHRDVVETPLVVAANVLPHLAQGLECSRDVRNRAERAFPGAGIDNREGAGGRPGNGNRVMLPILALHELESAGISADNVLTPPKPPQSELSISLPEIDP